MGVAIRGISFIMSMCCALLYLIAKMNENEATADYHKDTIMDTDMLV